MNLRRFSFIIFLLSSFFFLFLFFATSPKIAFAQCVPETSCGTCSTQSCSDGSPCNGGNNYCVWSADGNHYCGGCTIEVDNCASQCSAPPPTGCADPANAGQRCDIRRSGDYCCGAPNYVCNVESWWFCLGGSCQPDISFDSLIYHDRCALGSSCNPGCIPAPSCNYNRSYNQCCATGYSQNVQEYTYSDGSGVCNYVVGACNQSDAACGGAPPPPGATCNYNRTYNQCCATGLSERVDEYVWSNGSGACNYVVGACNQSDPACGSAPAPGPEPTPPPGSCYSSPSNPFQDTYTTGSSTVTIRHLGFDADGVIGGYANVTNTSTYRTVNMNDSNLECKPNINLQFTNNWGASSGRNFSLTDTINSKDAGNTLGAGWQLNSANSTIGDCSTTQVGPSQRTTNSGSDTYAATLYYCGDSQCACGETTSTCPADCAPAAPTGLSASCPAPGTTASLSWNSSPGATYYNVSYDALSQNNIALTSTTISGLTPGSSHTWGVKACNGAGCSASTTGTSFTCVPAAPTGLSASCPAPGNTASLSWNSSSGATYYNVSYDALSQNNIALTSTTISGLTPGSSHTWGVKACNGAGCSALTNGTGFTCALPPCPGGLGACGGIPQAGLPDPRTIGVCSGTWAYNPGPSLAYNIWCAANANPTRGYCYQCNSNITPWIQTTGDVHSNEGINAPGGP